LDLAFWNQSKQGDTTGVSHNERLPWNNLLENFRYEQVTKDGAGRAHQEVALVFRRL
jgi:hypothetical protein